MFERFTKDARAAVVLAQEIAREASSASIGPEHVALGVLDVDGSGARALRDAGIDPASVADRLRDMVRESGLDADALASLGIDLERVSRSADTLFGTGALERAGRALRGKGRRGSHIPFTADAKKALELSLREALRLQDNEINDRHVLLGVLRGGGPAAEALTGTGTQVATVRTALETRPEAA
ncbi:Clp protease N-terminal domain-containing protein [Georgenia halophila]|uniref:Clp protease N-terminal domain-containing protein n=1 Tax=Georgenia halophila TaxID=620889 RepID=A0ABP8L1U2_9MICO